MVVSGSRGGESDQCWELAWAVVALGANVEGRRDEESVGVP